MRKRIKLAPTFSDTVAQAEMSIAALAREASISEATIHQLMNPAQHPERKGGMYKQTAWKIANAFARLTQRTPHEAYQQLIIEVEE